MGIAQAISNQHSMKSSNNFAFLNKVTFELAQLSQNDNVSQNGGDTGMDKSNDSNSVYILFGIFFIGIIIISIVFYCFCCKKVEPKADMMGMQDPEME